MIRRTTAPPRAMTGPCPRSLEPPERTALFVERSAASPRGHGSPSTGPRRRAPAGRGAARRRRSALRGGRDVGQAEEDGGLAGPTDPLGSRTGGLRVRRARADGGPALGVTRIAEEPSHARRIPRARDHRAAARRAAPDDSTLSSAVPRLIVRGTGDQGAATLRLAPIGRQRSAIERWRNVAPITGRPVDILAILRVDDGPTGRRARLGQLPGPAGGVRRVDDCGSAVGERVSAGSRPVPVLTPLGAVVRGTADDRTAAPRGPRRVDRALLDRQRRT